ncbi:alpha/beta fold hydrolase [uncultured Roseibium sp.]|uniref:alpha/beta hydrolase family protein n=1 Tax=uncultured Roseibium sp. TaxID=1936171 RepID=UPI00262886A0|nr:alpha/beta fold hydrolase [uncultured Roseibium sp.]
MNRAIHVLLSISFVFGLCTVSQANSAIEIEHTQLEVRISGRAYSLDALIARPSKLEAGERLPVALISHGAAGRELPGSLTLALLSGWVRSFGARGYLAVAIMRRGYGESDGPAIRGKDTCEHPEPEAYLQKQADDIAAALDAIGRRGDADSDKVLLVGHSAGGAAMLALAAREDVPVSAVLNISGGTFRYRPGEPLLPDVFEGCELYSQAMDTTFVRLAQTNHVPTLWLYAVNDPYFPPRLARRWMNLWLKSGGQGQLQILDAYQSNGHRMFIHREGQEVLWPKIDRFLKTQKFPTWNDAKFDELRRALGPRQRQKLNKFLASGTAMKAFAVPIDGKTKSYWFTDAFSLQGARAEAYEFCRQDSGQDCIVVVENFEPTGMIPGRLNRKSKSSGDE